VVPSCGDDGTNVIKVLGELNENIAKRKGMDKLTIYRFQAELIQDTFRIGNNAFEFDKKETSFDRDAMQAWQMIKNVLEGKIDQHVPRILPTKH
jgi:hypothetical protein